MRRLSVAVAILCGSALAWAGSAIDVEVHPTALAGEGLPRLDVHVQTPLRSMRLSVRRSSDGRQIERTVKRIPAGRTHSFELPLGAPGTAQFVGTLTIEMAGGDTGTLPIDVEVTLLAPLEVSVAPESVDLDAHQLLLRANRPLSRVEVKVLGDDGRLLANGDQGAVAEGPAFRVQWEQQEGVVLRISLRAYDEHGYFKGLELHPWRVDIPHEDVNFETGLSRIPQAEIPKLKESLRLIREALARYGRFAQGLSLFVAGHTDRVGDAASNRVLSEQRAQAIGRWFRSHGVKVPIRCAGFGEEVLRVETADGVDEPRNRRAAYIVAVDPPLIRGRAVRWSRL